MVHKVFQWASGTVGRNAIAAVSERSNLELVGLHVRSADKQGLDAGEIAGIERLGVPATTDLRTVLDSDAEIVIHAPLASLVYGDQPEADIEDICALLASGKNVITVVGYMYPKVHGEALVARLENACAEGRSTFHSTGLNPGWMGDLVPLLMSGLSRRIDAIVVREITNFQFYPSPEIMFESMGFGQDPETFARTGERRRHWLNGLFRESIQMVADGIGLSLDDIAEQMSTELAPEDLNTAAGVVKAGTVAGQHWEWSGRVDETKRIVHETVWRMHDVVADDWPRGNHSVTIEGSPRMHLEFEANWIDDGLAATAMHAVNAIPAVCAAPPGIRTFLDLPWIFAGGET